MANLSEITAKFRGLTLENVGSWPLLPRMTLWGALVVICAIVGYFAVWSGQMSDLDGLRAQEAQLKDQYRAKLQQSINLDELRRQKEQVNQYVLTLEKQLPSKAEMDALLSDINQAGIGRGLQFELFRPGQVVLRDYYAELPISVKVSGRYHDLGAFASDIANLPRHCPLAGPGQRPGLPYSRDRCPVTSEAASRGIRSDTARRGAKTPPRPRNPG